MFRVINMSANVEQIAFIDVETMEEAEIYAAAEKGAKVNGVESAVEIYAVDENGTITGENVR